MSFIHKTIDTTDIMHALDIIEQTESIGKLMVVCGEHCKRLSVATELYDSGKDIIWFQDFSPNPLYEEVKRGTELFNSTQCDSILAIGGGSAMDVAKCIKLFSTLDSHSNYLEQEYKANDIPLIAIPTTAGTGSEATRFAVIYYEQNKQSITHDSIIPSYVIFIPELLYDLPLYQKKATMFDALCHAVESMWSVNSTDESLDYSKRAIKLILENYQGYLDNEIQSIGKMLEASNIAGKAINITQTTAGHAMCYKITSLYGIAHGHAAALCVKELWEYMICNTERCIDQRGEKHLLEIFKSLDKSFLGERALDKQGDCSIGKTGVDVFKKLFDRLDMDVPVSKCEDIDMLVKSVNLDRLKNNPIKLDEDTIRMLYQRILSMSV